MKEEKNITKIYITSRNKLTERDICYVVMSNKGYILSINKLTPWNYIAEFEYNNHEELLSILKTKEVRGKEISVKRVFKSLKLSPFFKKTPSRGFILQVIMGITGLIKKKVNIRITNNRADDWQRLMTKMWQEELDHPNIFKKAGIKSIIDIAPNGELEFCIVRGKDYVITFFNEIIDKYI